MVPLLMRKKWRGCLGGLSCFGAQKNGKRVVPSSRIPEGNSSSNPQNRPQNGVLANHATSIAPSLLAPPSSPISLSNSAIPSTVQSPSCFLSATSPERPSNTMFVTGPYAHETQLVSPPVFSTYTTQPSTAPLTPPPELAHITTPSSPDVPYAQYLSSSTNLKGMDKNKFLSSYSPYSTSPGSTNRSPISRGSDEYFSQSNKNSNFFCPATFAQYYLDNPPNSGGRLSVSKESDVCSNGYQNNNRQNNNNNNKSCKQDGDEIEAYRASFGFSADDIITTPHYVEINDIMDESLTIWSANKVDESSFVLGDGAACDEALGSGANLEGHKSWRQVSAQSTPGNHNASQKDNIFSWKGNSRSSRKYHRGLSSSDAEIDYRRARSLRERKAANSEWRD